MNRIVFRAGLLIAASLITAAGQTAFGQAPATTVHSDSSWLPSNPFVSKPQMPGEKSAPAPLEAEMTPAQSAKLCVTTAHQLAAAGHRREAILLLEKARTLDPKQAVARYLAVLYDEERMPQAIGEYQKALTATPNDPDLLNDYGVYFYRRGDLAQAEQWLRRALEQAPKHQRAWVNLGIVLGSEGRYKDSFDAFCKVLPPGEAHSNLAMLLARNGDRQRAETACREALRLEPDLPQPKALLAYFYGPQAASNALPGVPMSR